ncbi:MAG: DUF4352 domain-containing protein [Clostridiales bacterium]|nr:DUF4352 domain-containing protein [Clostridiales bacterium]
MADEVNNQQEIQQAVYAAQKEMKKKKRKKTLIIFAVIAVILVVIISLASSGSDDSGVSKVGGSDSSEQDSSDSTDTSQTSFVEGDIVETKKLRITFTECSSNYTDYSTYWGPDDGYKVVRAAFTFENIYSSDVTLPSFDCYADDVVCEIYYGADDYNNPALETISAGKKFNAVVYFEVPEDAQSIVLECQTDYWSSDKIEFVIQ